MTVYNYTRTLTDGFWDVNNPKDVDANGDSVLLAKRIEDAISEKAFTIKMEGEDVNIDFPDGLTSEEETTLTNTYNSHKSANDVYNKTTCDCLISPDGSQFNVIVDNSGNLSTIEQS